MAIDSIFTKTYKLAVSWESEERRREMSRNLIGARVRHRLLDKLQHFRTTKLANLNRFHLLSLNSICKRL